MSIVFITHMRKEPRGLLTGILFLIYLITIGTTGLFSLFYYSEILQKNTATYSLVMVLGIIFVVAIALFPFVLIITYFIQGILILKKEGLRLKNVLSLAFSIALVIYIFVWPLFRLKNLTNVYEKPLLLIADLVYKMLSFIFIYLLFLMAMYCVSAILNLIHIGRNKKLDYIIVLGAGIKGKQVTPLLAGRIDKALELWNKQHQHGKFVVSGGQGADEVVSEAQAMRDYLLEKDVPLDAILMEDKSTTTWENLKYSIGIINNDWTAAAGAISADASAFSSSSAASTISADFTTAVVTSDFHVFRCAEYAHNLGLKADGIGSHTKGWYWPTAFIREFIAITKAHLWPYLVFASIYILINVLDYVFFFLGVL